MKIQRSKEDKLNATKEREKKEYQEEQRKQRQKLLAAFENERKQKEKWILHVLKTKFLLQIM